MAVIQAMIQKMMTPEMLLKAPDLISQVSDSVETNMSMDQIQELIQGQLNSGGSWNVKSMAAEGTGDSQVLLFPCREPLCMSCIRIRQV